MKTKLITLLILLAVSYSAAQTNNNDYFFKIGDHEFNGYVSLTPKYTTFDSHAAGILEFRLAINLNDNWIAGFNASGLDYDKKLRKLVNDGTYHIEAGYIGFYIERIFDLTDDFNISLSLMMGSGLTKYRYDKDYRKDKVWYEETIDQTTFFVTEPSIEIQHRISGNFWMGLTGSFRNTSEIEMIETDKDILKKFNGGITFKYGVF